MPVAWASTSWSAQRRRKVVLFCPSRCRARGRIPSAFYERLAPLAEARALPTLRLPGAYSDQVKSQFLSCRLLLFELGPYPGDGGDVIVIEGIDEIFLH